MKPQDIKVKISEIIKRNSYIKSFRFSLPGADFKAGQYMIVTLNVGGRDISKPLSISSSPTEIDYLEFTKKLTKSDFSNALNSLKVGDEIKVRLPYGNFTLKEEKNITFLTGGIGITPIRSMCKFLSDSRSNIKVNVLLSIRTPEDDVFREDFDLIEKKSNNIKVARTITTTDIDKEKYNLTCRFGLIDKDMIQCEVPDCSERIFYISGPPQMVDSMKCLLKEELMLLDANIITENFVGY